MSDLFENARVGDVVAKDFRTAAVFQQFGIDFCCGGRRSIVEACRGAGVDPDAIFHALEGLRPEDAAQDDVASWPLDRLVARIVETHHAYIRSATPVIAGYLAKLVSVHGARHPELARIESAFGQMSRDLAPHLLKEEHVLFPYIAELLQWAGSRDQCVHSSPFGSVGNPVRMMEREHEAVGNEMRLVRELSSDFTPPEDGCTTYRVCFAELLRFEQDLHRHVHLENNVLFPRVQALESTVCRG
jgi:regulator of cell morphogenesis and NO signaling